MRFGFLAALLWPVAFAQTLTDPAKISLILERLQPSSAGDRLECVVEPLKPTLNFGLRIQSGYVFRVKLRQFSGPGHSLTVLTRVAPAASAPPAYLLDTIQLPPVPPTGLEAEFGGGFFLGEGHYRVNWGLIDDRGRTCRADWQLDAALGRGERALKLVMPPDTVAEPSLRASSEGGLHRDAAVTPMRLTVLLDAAPLVPRGRTRSELQPSDQVRLLGTLSALLEHLPATSVRLVAFNLDQQKELFRRDGFTLDSMDDLAGSLNQLQLSKVNVAVLQSPTGYLDLLARLINQELHAQPLSGTVIFLGPRERFQKKLPAGALDRVEGPLPRFFFLQYEAPVPLGLVPGPDRMPRRRSPDLISDRPPGMSMPGVLPDPPGPMPDTVTLAVATLKGTTVPIHSPADFAKAIQQIERRPAP